MRGRNSKLYKQAGSTRDVGDGEPSAEIDLKSSSTVGSGIEATGTREEEIAKSPSASAAPTRSQPGDVLGFEMWDGGGGCRAGSRLWLISQHRALNGSAYIIRVGSCQNTWAAYDAQARHADRTVLDQAQKQTGHAVRGPDQTHVGPRVKRAARTV